MKIVLSPDLMAPIGPYSQAIVHGGMVYCSGQIPLTQDGQLAGDTIQEQTEQVLQNLQHLLKAAGTDLHHVVKNTVFLTDLANFQAMNEVYSKYFQDHLPARTTVQISHLPKDVLIEIDSLATLPE